MAQHHERLLLFEREYEEAIGATKNVHNRSLSSYSSNHANPPSLHPHC
jgi:hypothetical protein